MTLKTVTKADRRPLGAARNSAQSSMAEASARHTNHKILLLISSIDNQFLTHTVSFVNKKMEDRRNNISVSKKLMFLNEINILMNSLG